jgi:hypothetical protein
VLPSLQSRLPRAGPSRPAPRPCRIHRHSPCRCSSSKARSPEVFRLRASRGMLRCGLAHHPVALPEIDHLPTTQRSAACRKHAPGASWRWVGRMDVSRIISLGTPMGLQKDACCHAAFPASRPLGR